MLYLIGALVLGALLSGYKQLLYPAFAIVLIALAIELVGAWREGRRERKRGHRRHRGGRGLL